MATQSKFVVPQYDGRLLLVSNRLPITIRRSESSNFDLSLSSGGLVSGLSGLSKSSTYQWYGWPGLEVPENEIDHLKATLKEKHNAVPVMITDDLANKHYNGFSSTTCQRHIPYFATADCYRFDTVAAVPLSSE